MKYDPIPTQQLGVPHLDSMVYRTQYFCSGVFGSDGSLPVGNGIRLSREGRIGNIFLRRYSTKSIFGVSQIRVEARDTFDFLLFNDMSDLHDYKHLRPTSSNLSQAKQF
jgi:hypothetical protein